MEKLICLPQHRFLGKGYFRCIELDQEADPNRIEYNTVRKKKLRSFRKNVIGLCDIDQ